MGSLWKELAALARRSGDNRGIAVEDLGRDANAAGRGASDPAAERGYERP
jgi:hypothetical protein